MREARVAGEIDDGGRDVVAEREGEGEGEREGTKCVCVEKIPVSFNGDIMQNVA